MAAAVSIGLSSLVLAQTVPPTPPGGTEIPDQPAVIRDVERSDPFCVRIEDLVASGLSLAEARATALQEFVAAGGVECLVFELEIIYCDQNGKARRMRRLVDSNCLDALWNQPGCTPLTCPPGWSPPAPCVLPTCANPNHRPMWDMAINSACFNLPPSIRCAWVHPTTTVPFWAPCEGHLACGCFPELSNCPGPAVECRNPSQPQQVGDACPTCS